MSGARELRLSNGMTATVSAGDYDRVKDITWHWHETRKGYGRVVNTRKVNGKTKYTMLHRLILDAPAGTKVDHVDRNTLNNTRENLRFCTDTESQCNRAPFGSTGYKGVTVNRRNRLRKFQAVIAYRGKDYYLGCYHTAEDAAVAYDMAARRLHGEFAYLNFPDRQLTASDAVLASLEVP